MSQDRSAEAEEKPLQPLSSTTSAAEAKKLCEPSNAGLKARTTQAAASLGPLQTAAASYSD